MKEKTEVKEKTEETMKEKTEETKAAQEAPAGGKRKKKLPIYWIALGVYTLALVGVCCAFLRYTDKSLVQYEASLPEHKMAAYASEFQQKASDGSLTASLTMPEAENPFETTQMYSDLYASLLDGVREYTYEKDAGAYSEAEPVYTLLADGAPIARVALSAADTRTVFGILPITDWAVREVTPLFTQEPRDYTLWIPDCYQAVVNGIPLGADDLTGQETPYPAFANVAPYVKMPVLVEYRICGLLAEPDVEVLDEQGQTVAFTPDEQGNIRVDYNTEPRQMPEEYEKEALQMAQAWENFMTDDLPGPYHGLETIQKYLIRDSYYWEIADSYAHGVDITFISFHTLPASPYTDVAVTDYVPYGENCYSCHIYFNKTMILGSGSRRTDTINSTFYFVYYDDTDDGVDNPHWAIADMLASSEGT